MSSALFVRLPAGATPAGSAPTLPGTQQSQLPGLLFSCYHGRSGDRSGARLEEAGERASSLAPADF